MIYLTYTEINTIDLEEDELFDALYLTWQQNKSQIGNISNLKNCWEDYECDILDHLFIIGTGGQIEDTNLQDILTDDFWSKFYQYINDDE